MKQQGRLMVTINALVLLCALLLAGCVDLPKPTDPAKIKYTVQYLVNGEVYREQRVEEGSAPNPVSTSLQGLTVLGWQNEAGQLVEPHTVPVTKDVTYKLSYYPALNRHVPYLFLNTRDQLRPDDILTEKELTQALEAVAAAGAKTYFPELPNGAGQVDGEFLRKILLNFYPDDVIRQALTTDEAITRSQFATVMNTLLGRSLTASLTLDNDAQIPVDMVDSRADLAALLEASVGHKETDGGITWAEVDVPTALEPGFLLKDGYLYYVTEDRYYLKDGKVGTLQFGETGRYTSGDLELDDLVAERIRIIQQKKPNATGEDLLYQVFVYCRDSFKYVSRGYLEAGATGWEISWAKEMLQKNAGNCYSYNATFWALARGIGYDAYCFSGYTAKDYQPHAWAQIDFDGKAYIFDPQLARRYLDNGKNHPMYKLPYETAVKWPYHWPED